MDMRVRKPKGHPMPEIAGFVAAMKAAFCAAEIDDAICRGKAGAPTFYARENGRSVGTPASDQINNWRVDSSLRDRHYCAGCDGACVGTENSCKA
ncbi:hypothetical protein [Paraburkholderia sp. GAS199]|uniref:hypothetical protein n=1 Tax=Paraburkholderia sp. GAS199 TaxID=3035126 RepID=UPI003D1DB3E7